MEYTLSKESASLFESIKHIDENGVEFWFGRELAPYLGYAQWRNFESVIEKAKDACKTAFGDVLSNFAGVSKIVKTGVAENAGVKEPWEYARFQNAGYRGLYNGMDEDAIHRHKGLTEKQRILDHMGSTELAANLFRATQAEEKLRKENIQGKDQANAVHYSIGVEVRKTIERIGGTMPEDLPSVESIKLVEKKQKQIEKANQKLIDSKKES